MTIQESFTYFLEHQQELYAKYPGQYLIITGNFIADVKPTLDMAVLYATSHYSSSWHIPHTAVWTRPNAATPFTPPQKLIMESKALF